MKKNEHHIFVYRSENVFGINRGSTPGGDPSMRFGPVLLFHEARNENTYVSGGTYSTLATTSYY